MRQVLNYYLHFTKEETESQYAGFPGGSVRKESACSTRDLHAIPGLGRSPEKEMATHSSILAWRIPWTEEAGSL